MKASERPEFTEQLIDFLPYQKAWLEDKSRFKIGNMSRQAGKSFGTAAEIVEDVIDHEIAGTKTHWVVLSRGERQAVEYMRKNVIPMLKAYYILYRSILKNAKPPELVEVDYAFDRPNDDGSTEKVSYKSYEVELPCGARITALPANPDTARGFSANVLLDEFAFHADSRDIWKALYPCITRGYKIRVISTPNGKSNKFHELMTADDDTWSKHSVTIWDAVEQGLDIDPHELRAGLGDEDAWAQEYELEWADGDSPALPWDDIISCEEDGAGDPAGFRGGATYGGNDIAGKGNDLWVLTVLEDVGGRLWERESIDRRKASFAEQDRLLDACVERYRMRRIAMDETSIGAKPVEDAEGRYGASRVQGIVFTQSSKHNIVQCMQKAFQDRRLAIRPGDVKLRADLHSVKKVVSKNGGLPRYIAPTGAESHADRFWALGLAIYAAEGGEVEYAYHPAGRNTHDPDPDYSKPRVRTTSGLKSMRGAY